MPILRLLLIVLVALNLLALAAGQGWLGSSEPRGEPERVTNQLNPERIVIQRRVARQPTAAAPALTPVSLDPTPAPAAPPATVPAVAQSVPAHEPEPEPDRCIGYSGLSSDQADQLEQTLSEHAPMVRAERTQERGPNGWWVRLPPAGSREAADRRVSELRAVGVTDFYIMHEAGPNQFAISLGLFKTEAGAKQHLAFLQGKRVRGAGVVARNGVIHTVELHGSDASLQELAGRLAREMPAALRGECAP